MNRSIDDYTDKKHTVMKWSSIHQKYNLSCYSQVYCMKWINSAAD